MSERHYNNETRTARLMEVMERDGPYCMGKGCFIHLSQLKPIDVHLHHIKPLKEGGCDHIVNQVALCRGCHSKESKGTLELNSMATRLPLCVCGNNCADTVTEAHAKAGEGGRVYIDQSIGKFRYQTEQDLAKEKADADTLQAAKEDAALTPVMRVNKRCEKPFHKWITDMIQSGLKYDFETWINAGGNEFKCSTETVRKYLNKRTNPINGDLIAKTEIDGSGATTTYLAFRKLTE